MAERIRFYFDPLCPWCYQTSRWARRLDELGVVDVEWRVFSLAIVNGGDEGRAAADTGSVPSLRTAIAVRDAHGNDAVGAFYKALSDARHLRGLPLEDHAVIEAALREAGLEPALLQQALDDPATWDAVQREHDEAVSRVQGIRGADHRARRRRRARTCSGRSSATFPATRVRSTCGSISPGWRAIPTWPR